MDFKEILEFKLIDIAGYSLSVYSVILMVLVYTVARLFLFLFGRFFVKLALKRQIDIGRQHSFYLMFKYLIWVIAGIAILSVGGLSFNWILASSAVLLVGLGLGLQQIFSDILSGVLLLFEGTVEKGDVIEVDGVVGRIEEIRLRTTQFRNRDDQMMIIPNHKFVTDNVVNWSHDNHVSRFTVKVGVSHKSDVQQVKKILLDCARMNKDVIKDIEAQSPRVRFDDFADSSLDFSLQFYSTSLFRIETVKSDLRFAIWDAFNSNGVKIPFPQRDLHLKSGDWALTPAS
jgi:small-conductance mechanosensitive channel